MGRTDNELDAHCHLVIADLTSTLGGDHSARVVSPARELRAFSGPGLGQRLVEDIQQQIPDEHISTTWPPCPVHGTHPLWVRDGQWVCLQSGLAVTSLGQLGNREGQ